MVDPIWIIYLAVCLGAACAIAVIQRSTISNQKETIANQGDEINHLNAVIDNLAYQVAVSATSLTETEVEYTNALNMMSEFASELLATEPSTIRVAVDEELVVDSGPFKF